LDVANYFELVAGEAAQIAAEVGKAVASWRKVAAKLSLTAAEIDRMASAFEHEDLKAALALTTAKSVKK
jgi:serine/threonine-protein kinase HipA